MKSKAVCLCFGFLLCIACISVPLFAGAAIVLDKVVAIVNQEVITWSELYKAMEFEAAPELKTRSIEERRAIFKQHETAFLENLIDMRLVLQEARKSGVGSTSAEVDRAIASIKEKYRFDDKAFADSIAKEGFTLAEYKTKLSEQLILNRVIDQEVRSKIVVTDTEIDKMLAENKDLAGQSEGFDMGLIFIRKNGPEGVPETKAHEAYTRIVGGTAFAEVAAAYSDDPSGKRGGELGFIRRSDLSKQFADKLALLKPGGVTEPFRTDAGFYILKLNEAISFKSPQEFREALRSRISRDRFNSDYKAWIKGLRQRAYIEVK